MATLAPLTDANARITPELFDAMLERGDLAHVHVELFDGTMLFKMPQGELHSFALMLIARALWRAADPLGLWVAQQSTVRMSDDRPEPDAAIVALDPRTARGPMTGSDVRLAVEIAVSSLALDRQKKALVYAAQGIPEYWIVNPVARQIEVYREPSLDGYRSLTVAGEDETISCLALPGSSFLVGDLMPMPDPE